MQLQQFTDKLARVAGKAAAWLPDALMLGGAGSASYGAGLIYTPAGYIVAGAFALVAGWLLSRGAA